METQTKTMNGFDLEAMHNTVGAIQQNSAIGAFQLRAENRWITGGHNHSTVQGFYGACQEDTTREVPFEFTCDEPFVLLGTNKGANPGEVLLYGLLACMTTTMVLLATAQGIEVEGVSSRIEGDVDLRGFLGLDGLCLGPRVRRRGRGGRCHARGKFARNGGEFAHVALLDHGQLLVLGREGGECLAQFGRHRSACRPRQAGAEFADLLRLPFDLGAVAGRVRADRPRRDRLPQAGGDVVQPPLGRLGEFPGQRLESVGQHTDFTLVVAEIAVDAGGQFTRLGGDDLAVQLALALDDDFTPHVLRVEHVDRHAQLPATAEQCRRLLSPPVKRRLSPREKAEALTQFLMARGIDPEEAFSQID